MNAGGLEPRLGDSSVVFFIVVSFYIASLVPRPRPQRWEEGLVTLEHVHIQLFTLRELWFIDQYYGWNYNTVCVCMYHVIGRRMSFRRSMSLQPTRDNSRRSEHTVCQ